MTRTEPSSDLLDWLPEATAILVVHGIGNQEPLQTLDQFGRGLLAELRAHSGLDLELIHGVAAEPGDRYGIGHWLRIRPRDGRVNQPALDIYEYYWADLTQDRASVIGLQEWLDDAVAGAKDFYEQNRKLVEDYERLGSPFFRNGRFVYWRYWWFLFLVGRVIPWTTGLLTWLVKVTRAIPVVGMLASSRAEWLHRRGIDVLVNVVGDIVIFNSVKARSRFLETRNRILNGCVAALRRLVEPLGDAPYRPEAWPYRRVIVAGHSLGSQVTFEALNRLDIITAGGDLRGFDSKGQFTDGTEVQVVEGKQRLADLLCGYVTFGSPLDKVAFFFREQASKEETLRRQMLSNLRCFKHKPWESVPDADRMAPPLPRLLDEIAWINYHDSHDPVSGSLDYYEPLVNEDCKFEVQSRPGLTRLLIVGLVVWLISLLSAAVYWGWQLCHVQLGEALEFSLASFIQANWPHAVYLGLFLFGSVLLLFLAAAQVAGTFTHLWYWEPMKSTPLYRGVLEYFLCVSRVPAAVPPKCGSSTSAEPPTNPPVQPPPSMV